MCSQDGLPGFGKRVAHGLARHGFGMSLCNAFWDLGRSGLAAFLPGWRDEIRHVLRTDEHNFLRRRYPKLSQQIPDSWPNVDVLANYVNPATSAPAELEDSWPQPPNIAHLGRLCERYFSWGTRAGITKHFGSALVPGISTRILIFRAVNQDRIKQIKQGKEVGLYEVCRSPVS